MNDLEKKRIDGMQLFILQYKTAAKQGWSRSRLAEYLGVTQDSVRRRALTVKHTMRIVFATITHSQ